MQISLNVCAIMWYDSLCVCVVFGIEDMFVALYDCVCVVIIVTPKVHQLTLTTTATTITTPP
jgi:hypothetical protein